jgi:dTDP-4-dehydrorhamnose 3,5-epimerase
MGQIKVEETGIKDLYVLVPKVYQDNRGYFMESYNYRDFRSTGLDMIFVQDNQSKSGKGVLRGLHYQKQYPQGKLVRVVSGEVFDVAVDLRRDSPTYKKWFGVILSGLNKKQLYIPEGFAHGFLVLSEGAEFCYKCTDYYHPEDESGIIWSDPEIGINWPLGNIDEIIISEKDKMWKKIEYL